VRQRRKPLFITACAAVFLLVFLCVQGFAEGPAAMGWGEERVAEKAVSVRLKPDAASPLVRTLKPGDRVRVDFAQANGWVALFDMTETQRDVNRAIGYAEAAQLVPASQYKPQAPATTKTPSQTAKPEGKSAPTPEIKSEVKAGPTPLGGSAPAGTKQDPVRITSDKMVYSQPENAVVFIGNVHGTQADMAIWAAKVTAYFEDKSKGKDPKAAKAQPDKGAGDMGGDSKIDRIVAEGDVRLVAGKNEGACSTLTYYVADGVLRMEGNPILREGQNTVRGDVIKYYMKENRSEVLSGAQRRVEAVFFSPKGDKK
jgi:lipopolysaccharide export system protein LptA